MLLDIEYPITRRVESRFLAPIAYTIAFLALLLLTVLNVALTGYEPVTTYKSDYNSVQSFWYQKLFPYKVQKPGTLCEPHVLNVGESISTSNAIFEWRIRAVTRANAGKSGVSYNGTTLQHCDIAEIVFFGDLRTWAVQFIPFVQCQAEGELDIIVSTPIRLSGLSGSRSPLLGILRSLTTDPDPVSRTIFNLMEVALNDLGNRTGEAFVNSNGTGAVVLSFDAIFQPCPASLGPSAVCANTPPHFDLVAVSSILPTGDLVLDPFTPGSGPKSATLEEAILPPVTNFLHLIHAAVHLDLGNPSPNNFLTHPNVLNQTIASEFPATALTKVQTSQLYAAWQSPPTTQDAQYSSLPVPGPASFQAVYLCHFQAWKSPGALVISVLVATLSMFSTGWALFILAATHFAKRGSKTANCCEGHGTCVADQKVEMNDLL